MTALVLDAATAVDLVVAHDAAGIDPILADADVVTVAHLDAEVLSALARLHRDGQLTADEVVRALDDLDTLPIHRLPITALLLRRAWSLRHNVAMRDALYVAAAMHLGARVLTTDARLRRAAPDHTVGPDEIGMGTARTD